MKRLIVPGTDVEITRLGISFGAFAGGDWNKPRVPLDESECLRIVTAALGHGVLLVELAPWYADGYAEELYKRHFRKQPAAILGRCGVLPDNKRQLQLRVKPDVIVLQCEQSLKRLGVEAMDFYLLTHSPVEHEALEGALTLLRLQKQGKIRWPVLESQTWTLLPEALRSEFPVLGCSSNLLQEKPVEQSKANFSWAPLAHGTLGVKNRSTIRYEQEGWSRHSAESALEQALVRLERELLPHATSVAQVALCWVLEQQIASVLVSCRSLAQLEELLLAEYLTIAPELQATLQQRVNETLHRR